MVATWSIRSWGTFLNGVGAPMVTPREGCHAGRPLLPLLVIKKNKRESGDQTTGVLFKVLCAVNKSENIEEVALETIAAARTPFHD
ncbi:hypothetical protein TorRG33x02_338780 [Trema orientale]|uniref:Uncharacterized protein n=1 Tax=Trema orientale TaxID=63057 RepID=A0A2P5AX55_TREOI|nr:hypothetical protein TorRG33x02_338780 [Trema orientale]